MMNLFANLSRQFKLSISNNSISSKNDKTVKIYDIKQLIQDETRKIYTFQISCSSALKFFEFFTPKTLNQQLKLLLTMHLLLTHESQKVSNIARNWVQTGDFKINTLTLNQAYLEKQLQTEIFAQPQKGKQNQSQQNMHLNQLSKIELSNEFDQQFVNYYYVYIQKLSSSNNLIRSNCLRILLNSEKFPWLYKALNCLHYLGSSSSYLMNSLSCQSENIVNQLILNFKLIISDISLLIFNDLKCYYKLVWNELQTFRDEYMIIEIDEDLQFLEIYQQFKLVNLQIIKINEFMNYQIKKSILKIRYFDLTFLVERLFEFEKKEEIDIEVFINKMKLLLPSSRRKQQDSQKKYYTSATNRYQQTKFELQDNKIKSVRMWTTDKQIEDNDTDGLSKKNYDECEL